MKSIQCDLCMEKFEYEPVEYLANDGIITEVTDVMPDGYFFRNLWICDLCGSCCNCGKSLEKEGNLLEKKQDKECQECTAYSIKRGDKKE